MTKLNRYRVVRRHYGDRPMWPAISAMPPRARSPPVPHVLELVGPAPDADLAPSPAPAKSEAPPANKSEPEPPQGRARRTGEQGRQPAEIEAQVSVGIA